MRDQISSIGRRRKELLSLSHELGRAERGWAILGEGNASARIDDEMFLVKASGSNLGTLTAADVVACRTGPLLELLDKRSIQDDEVSAALLGSRVDARSKKPSVEALFHAYLLTLPGVEFVGHTHAPAVNRILCSPDARKFASERIFPDEVVCCGIESLYIPYVDPGFSLAQTIRQRMAALLQRQGEFPQVVLLQNHGIITFGRTREAVLAAMMMSEKAAGIWLGAAMLGGPVVMSRRHVKRIAGRQDEEVRRREMKI